MQVPLEGVAVQTAATPVFHTDWFQRHIPLWEILVREHLPRREKFLEVGSFEGESACWMLQHALDSKGTLYCVDTWEGSPEFWILPREVVTQSFEQFANNVNVVRGVNQQVIALKNRSTDALAGLIHLEHAETFDLVYIDGGHRAAEALADACMAWPLLRSGGLMIFDDYTWDLHGQLTERPKMAVDAFTTIYSRDLKTLSVGEQYAVQKK